MSEKPKRRWYQFSLRALLVVLTVLCLVPGSYLAYEGNRRRTRTEAVEAIEKLGGEVNGWMPSRDLRKLRFVFGDDFEMNNVILQDNQRVSDADLALLDAFPELEELDLRNTNISDKGLSHVARLTNLKWLGLANTRITDAGLIYLKDLQNLETLSLEDTQITDAGLPHLAGLKSIKFIRLGAGSKITDTAIKKFEASIFPHQIISRN